MNTSLNLAAASARRVSRAIVLPLAVAMIALPAGAGAASSTRPVSLKTKHEFAHRSASFCGKHQRVRVFHHNQVIEYRGLLTPATGRHFAVKIQVKRCVHGHFKTVARYSSTGKKSGKFKVFVRAPRIGHGRHARASYFYARATVNGQRSQKTYFAVTR
ncbi:MAG: hypothetical protein LC720_04045 [Actinobacteria bacterium]|nr:hypothetical protein [Actinomycetota bacterium]